MKRSSGCLMRFISKRIRDMLPPLPQGVMPSYIQYLDVIHSLQREKKDIRLSDISDA